MKCMPTCGQPKAVNQYMLIASADNNMYNLCGVCIKATWRLSQLIVVVHCAELLFAKGQPDYTLSAKVHKTSCSGSWYISM
jgi:hypothetical protein